MRKHTSEMGWIQTSSCRENAGDPKSKLSFRALASGCSMNMAWGLALWKRPQTTRRGDIWFVLGGHEELIGARHGSLAGGEEEVGGQQAGLLWGAEGSYPSRVSSVVLSDFNISSFSSVLFLAFAESFLMAVPLCQFTGAHASIHITHLDGTTGQ
ncbi:unnamed protein product [Natator depressus]